MSYEAGGVHLLLVDQVGDVVAIVGDSFHTAHKVLFTSRAQPCGYRQSSKADLRTQRTEDDVKWS